MKKMKINLWSVLLATLVAFIISSIWYANFGKLLMQLHGVDPLTAQQDISPLTMLLELARTFILGIILAYFVGTLQINQWMAAIKLTAILWIGFPFILLTGSILHENFPWRIAIIHAGDWFIKPLAMILILSWQNHKRIVRHKKDPVYQ